MRDWLRYVTAGRPGWMNALMVFSAYMAFVYVPWDFLVKPRRRILRHSRGPPIEDERDRVYGYRISYNAGKLEAYLRYRGIAYELLPMSLHAKEMIVVAGAFQPRRPARGRARLGRLRAYPEAVPCDTRTSRTPSLS
jgi:hypothetical protein